MSTEWPPTHPYCTFVVEPALGHICRTSYRLWTVRYRVGTDLTMAEPLIRCSDHLVETIRLLAPGSYPDGYLDGVEKIVSASRHGD